MGNGEWGMGNGEWGMGNGEWGMGNGEWGMGNGEWGMGNGEWGMGNGEWKVLDRLPRVKPKSREPGANSPSRRNAFEPPTDVRRFAFAAVAEAVVEAARTSLPELEQGGPEAVAAPVRGAGDVGLIAVLRLDLF